MMRTWVGSIGVLVLAKAFLCHAGGDTLPNKINLVSEKIGNRNSDESLLAPVYAAIYKGNLDDVKQRFSELDAASISKLNVQICDCPNAEIIAFFRDKGLVALSDLQMAAAFGDVNTIRTVMTRLRKAPGAMDAVKQALNVDHHGDLTSNTPLRLAIRHGKAAVVRELIAAGANVNEQVIAVAIHRVVLANEFPLTEAVKLGNAEIVQLLVAGGAILEEPGTRYRSKEGKVNLHEFYRKRVAGFYGENAASHKVAVEKELKEMFDAGLLVQEIDPNANELCPLALATENGRVKIVSILLKAGANPNVLIGGRHRPLHTAAIKGNPEIVRLLIKHGADVNAPTSTGQRPLDCAVQGYHGDIADILRAAGAKPGDVTPPSQAPSQTPDPQPMGDEAPELKPSAATERDSKAE